ncbi:Hypothetical predicted protein, partial [Mytilus galloprovincialis]
MSHRSVFLYRYLRVGVLKAYERDVYHSAEELKMLSKGEDTNSGSCRLSGIAPQLLFSNGTLVFSQDLDGDNLKILVDTIMDNSVLYVDYDLKDGYLYWSDLNTNTISRRRCASGNESSVKEVIIQKQSNSKPIGIAVDSLNGHLYWAELNGGPIRRLLYFSDHGRHTIERCKFDGSSRQTLISEDVISPYGLAL